MNKEFAVIGLGRFGGSIVRELRELETDVLAIDSDEERVNEFADIATETVIGNTTDETVLKITESEIFEHRCISGVADHCLGRYMRKLGHTFLIAVYGDDIRFEFSQFHHATHT